MRPQSGCHDDVAILGPNHDRRTRRGDTGQVQSVRTVAASGSPGGLASSILDADLSTDDADRAERHGEQQDQNGQARGQFDRDHPAVDPAHTGRLAVKMHGVPTERFR